MEDLRLVDFEPNLAEVLPTLEAFIVNGFALVERLVHLPDVSFENLVLPISNLQEDLHEFWSPIAHLNNVADNDMLRKIHEAGEVLLSDFGVSLAQHQGLYQAYLKLQKSAEYSLLSKPEQKMIKDALLDFEAAGVALPEAARETFKQCEKELVAKTTKFEQNVMDAIKAWHYDTLDATEFDGVPEVLLVQAKHKAEAAGIKGYRFGIDAPTYLAVMGYATHAATRELFYRAYATRASDLGASQFDNSQVMVDLINLRAREARLLGFSHYADYTLLRRMAKNPTIVLEFLYDLAKRSRDKACRDWAELQAFAKSQGHDSPLQAWDFSYFSERLKEQQLGFNEEQLRPYFPLPQVWKGLLHLVETLFGIQFRAKKIRAWHDSVEFLEVYDHAGLIGGIYVDLYARDHKRSGAWMDQCRSLRVLPDGFVQRPLAFLNANFLPPTSGQDAQLTHDEVVTLFHELGHVLQHILTKISLPDIGGISGVPWDAVELPSQFMENFCYEASILKALSRHANTHDSLSDALIESIRASRTFMSGLMMLRQIEFALFDMRLYLQEHVDAALDIQKILDEVRHEVAVIIPPHFNRFQHGFSHIFAGGYAAGYYSYKWAELLSSDAFSRFEEEGILNPQVGLDFRNTILAEGGSRDAMDVFVDFRHRAPKIDALLKHSGII